MQNRALFSLAAAVFLAPLFAGSPYAEQAPAGQTQQNPQAQQPAPNGGQPGAPAGRAGAAGRGRGRGGRAPAPSKPAPRLASGRVQLNEKGVWIGGGGVGGRGDNVPYQAWARAVSADRRVNELEPHTRCKASGFQRQFLTPYGAEIVEMPEIQRVFIFDIGGPHTFRTIYTDGRSHPKNLQPSYYGHSIGWWEGDTLVVDTVGYNEGFWIDRGAAPHTDALHTVERFTRTEYASMRYELTVDDPGAYSEPWTAGWTINWGANAEMYEFICQENNRDSRHMFGNESKQ